LRSSQLVAPDRVRFVLRAQPIGGGGPEHELELSQDLEAEVVRDKIAHGQAIPTPELTFEQLWLQLRQDIDARDAG
jgi:hypothetical protein